MRAIWIKKIIFLIFLASLMGLTIIGKNSVAKAKVKVQIKNGTCYVNGKGAMDKKQIPGKKKKAKIKKLIIGKGVTSLPEKAFKGCKKLNSIKISGSVKRIEPYAFAGTGIKKLTIPKSVKYIGEELFTNCKNLKTVKMPGNFKYVIGTYPPKIYENLNSESDPLENVIFTTSLSGIAGDGNKIYSKVYCKNFYVSKKDENYVSDHGIIYSKDKRILVRVPMLKKKFTIDRACNTFLLSSLMEYNDNNSANYGSSKLENLVIPPQIKYIRRDEREDGYDHYITPVYFTSLKKLTVDSKQLSVKNVIRLYQFFAKKDLIEKALLNADYLKIYKKNFVSIGSRLVGYKGNEKEIVIPDEIIGIEKYVFHNSKITSVTFGENIKEIGEGAFEATSELKSVTFNEGLEKIDGFAFAGSAIEHIKLPESLKMIGCEAFSKTNLEEITVPENVTKIVQCAFDLNHKLKKAVLPQSITKIPKGLFKYCENLTDVEVSSELTEIKIGAFDCCKNLSIQKLLDSPKLSVIGQSAFCGIPFEELTIPSHVKEIQMFAFENFYSEEQSKKITVTFESSDTKVNDLAFKGRTINYIYLDKNNN